jgi:hypothetical protein
MAYTANKLKSQARRRMVDFDPDSASESIVTLNPAASEKCLALSAGFQAFLAGLVHSVGTGSITSFRIFVADDAAGTTNAANVVSHALGSDPNAVGDTIWLEATGEQVKAAMGSASAYIGVKVTLATSTDEAIVFFEEAEGRFKYDSLTADYVS